jgi:hypothetical protein
MPSLPLRPGELSLGFDPDLHHAGYALIGGEKRVYESGVVLGSKSTENAAVACMIDALAKCVHRLTWPVGMIVVESQRCYPGKHRHERPDDLIRLGQVAGAFAALAAARWPDAGLWIVDPQTWKGTIPKPVMHQRIRDQLGLVGDGQLVGGANESHVLDAAGLALFGLHADHGFRLGVGSAPRLARQAAR